VTVAVIGAGIVGISVAWHLARRHRRNVVLIDSHAPMSLTSARSGENFRNWWPHPVMKDFTTDSIAAMEDIAGATGNRIRMNRRGYALATRRADIAPLLAELHAGYGADADRLIRLHDGGTSYIPAVIGPWQEAPDGVDVIRDKHLISEHFPGFDRAVSTILHIRRGGDISGQQLGQYMLEEIRAAGGRTVTAEVRGIEPGFTLQTSAGPIRAAAIVNAAGPYIADIAAMLGESLPVTNVLQQKITFEDRAGAIPRARPFSIDLDGQTLAWSDDERAELAADPATAWLTRPMPGGIHCRPDGATWIKLGWAYNHTPSPPDRDPALDPSYPDIVLRGASRLQPALAQYIGRLPRNAVHYGGHYTMTEENWPLIGPMQTDGAFIAGALSGFGTMAACATGALCAAWLTGAPLHAYARALSRFRYEDVALMAGLREMHSKGVL